MTDDERAIRELVDTWMAASKAGDLDTVLSLMADDVIFMVTGREPFGKEEFAAASRSMTDLRIEGASEIKELAVLGDWAYLRNRLTITMTPDGGEAMLKRSGYTLSILRKEKDGAGCSCATRTCSRQPSSGKNLLPGLVGLAGAELIEGASGASLLFLLRRVVGGGFRRVALACRPGRACLEQVGPLGADRAQIPPHW